MTWKLNEPEDIECTPDDSGVYVVINRIPENQHSKGYCHTTVRIRVDIMDSNDEPLQSFIGEGNAVRKAVIAWLVDISCLSTTKYAVEEPISREHASYIGYEIARAMLDEHYVQS